MRAIAGIMIPASDEFGVPGADDATIFADILATARPSAQTVSAALRGLDELANDRFCDLAASEQRAVAERFRTAGSPLVGALVALVVQCYYRDDRVMRSLDMEPRPPFPRGYELADGDWSLLDPVAAAAPRSGRSREAVRYAAGVPAFAGGNGGPAATLLHSTLKS